MPRVCIEPLARQVKPQPPFHQWTVAECRVLVARDISNEEAWSMGIQRVTGPKSESSGLHARNARPRLVCPVCETTYCILHRPPGPDELTEWACNKCHRLTSVKSRTKAAGTKEAYQLVKDPSLLQDAFGRCEDMCNQIIQEEEIDEEEEKELERNCHYTLRVLEAGARPDIIAATQGHSITEDDIINDDIIRATELMSFIRTILMAGWENYVTKEAREERVAIRIESITRLMAMYIALSNLRMARIQKASPGDDGGSRLEELKAILQQTNNTYNVSLNVVNNASPSSQLSTVDSSGEPKSLHEARDLTSDVFSLRVPEKVTSGRTFESEASNE